MIPDADAIASAYCGTRERVIDLLRAADDEARSRRIPACPEWTAKELLAHLCGVNDDILNGRLDGVATEPWTQAQVQRFADRSFDEVLDEWGELGPQIDALIPAFPPMAAAQMTFDAVNHEHDLRAAFDQPGAQDSDAVWIGVDFAVESLDGFVRAHDLPTLEIRTGGRTMTAGDGQAGTGLDTTPFDLFRSFAGRRTVDQIRALDWDGDADPYLGIFEDHVLTPPAEPVE